MDQSSFIYQKTNHVQLDHIDFVCVFETWRCSLLCEWEGFLSADATWLFRVSILAFPWNWECVECVDHWFGLPCHHTTSKDVNLLLILPSPLNLRVNVTSSARWWRKGMTTKAPLISWKRHWPLTHWYCNKHYRRTLYLCSFAFPPFIFKSSSRCCFVITKRVSFFFSSSDSVISPRNNSGCNGTSVTEDSLTSVYHQYTLTFPRQFVRVIVGCLTGWSKWMRSSLKSLTIIEKWRSKHEERSFRRWMVMILGSVSLSDALLLMDSRLHKEANENAWIVSNDLEVGFHVGPTHCVPRYTKWH